MVLHDEPGMLALGMQCVGEDDRAVQVQVLEQRGERGDLIALGADLLLGDGRALVAGDSGQQVRRGAVLILRAAGGLAVHRDHHLVPGGILVRAVLGR